MKVISLMYKDGTDLMNYYCQDEPTGALVIKDRPKKRLGERVWLKIALRSNLEVIYLTGSVACRGTAYNRRNRPYNTMQVNFDSDEVRARQIMGRWMKHDLEEFEPRQATRTSVWLPGDIYHGELDNPILSTVRNISMNGVYTNCSVLLPQHTRVQIRLHSSTYNIRRTFLGVVTRLEKKDFVQGMGIQFLLDAREEQRELRDLLARISKAQLNRSANTGWFGDLSGSKLPS